MYLLIDAFLTDVLIFCARQTSDILYFETLDLPLPELQGLKTLKVAFHNAKTEEVCNLHVLYNRIA